MKRLFSLRISAIYFALIRKTEKCQKNPVYKRNSVLSSALCHLWKWQTNTGRKNFKTSDFFKNADKNLHLSEQEMCQFLICEERHTFSYTLAYSNMVHADVIRKWRWENYTVFFFIPYFIQALAHLAGSFQPINIQLQQEYTELLFLFHKVIDYMYNGHSFLYFSGT